VSGEVAALRQPPNSISAMSRDQSDPVMESLADVQPNLLRSRNQTIRPRKDLADEPRGLVLALLRQAASRVGGSVRIQISRWSACDSCPMLL